MPLSQYFAELHVEPCAQHFPDRDGFQLRLRMTHLLSADMVIDKVAVKLVAPSSSQGQDLLFEHNERLVLKRGVVSIVVGTHVSRHPKKFNHI